MPNNNFFEYLDLSKISIAILENWVKPILGKDAISAIKSPINEKLLRDSIIKTLCNTEQRFIAEFPDQDIIESVLNLPIGNLPIVIDAARDFYNRPTDNTLEKVISEQLIHDFPRLNPDRLRNGSSTYIAIFRQELALLSTEIREKINTETNLSIQNNTFRIATDIEKLLDILINPDFHNKQNQELQSLQFSLRERKNLLILQTAVYNAEALYSEGKLPDYLVDLMIEARSAFDEFRRMAGITTSVTRLGDLRVIKTHLENLNEMVQNGMIYYFNDVSGEIQPISITLLEINQQYFNKSKFVMEYIINVVNQVRVESPFYARKLIRDKLEEPLHYEHKEILNDKLIELENFINNHEQSRQFFITQNLTNQEFEITKLAIQEKLNILEISTKLNLSQVFINAQLGKVCTKLKYYYGLENADLSTLATYFEGFIS